MKEVIRNMVYFVGRFLRPHFVLLTVVLLTGVVAAASSGLGIPGIVKFVFPVVFDTAGDEVPVLLRYFPALATWERSTLLML